jgi:hypothetical protein
MKKRCLPLFLNLAVCYIVLLALRGNTTLCTAARQLSNTDKNQLSCLVMHMHTHRAPKHFLLVHSLAFVLVTIVLELHAHPALRILAQP